MEEFISCTLDVNSEVSGNFAVLSGVRAAPVHSGHACVSISLSSFAWGACSTYDVCTWRGRGGTPKAHAVRNLVREVA